MVKKSAFSVFCRDKRDAVKESFVQQGSRFTIGDVQKALSEQWRNVSAEDKQIYTERANRENEETEANPPPPPPAPSRADKALKHFPRTTGYMQYQHEVREAVRAELMSSGHKGAVGEISKVIAERWHTLPEDQKREFQDRAKLKNEETAKKIAAEMNKKDEDQEPDESAITNLEFPLSKVLKIMRSDDDLKKVTKGAQQAVSKATEFFLTYITGQAAATAKSHKRKAVKYDDIEEAIKRRRNLEFLRDHLHDLRPPVIHDPEVQPEGVELVETGAPVDAHSKKITDFF